MKHIKQMVLVIIFFAIKIPLILQADNLGKSSDKKTSSSSNTFSLPFSLQLSLDVLGLELKHYKDQFKNNGFNDIHAQIIIEEAEILVQTATPEIQNLLKPKIISLFQENDLAIQFGTNNKIIQVIQSITTPLPNDENKDNDDDKLEFKKEKIKKKKAKLLRPHKHKSKKAKQIFAPKKIHGARRTMRRLKKEQEEARRRAYEELKARIESKKNAVIAATRKNLTQTENLQEQAILKRSRLEKKMLQKAQENINLRPSFENENDELEVHL